jgi:hypothetical protein
MVRFCPTLAAVDFLRYWVGIILILAGLARAGLVVLHEPVAGYANRGDMTGTSACIGLFPVKEGVGQSPTPDAPLSTYALGSRTDGCYQGIEMGIAATAVAIARATGVSAERIPLHWVGWTKLAILFATAFVVAWLLRDQAGAAFVHGLVVLLVLADPAVTLWMNTLYTEFAAIWGLYAIVMGCVVLALYDRFSLLGWLLAIAGFLVLAFSREQYTLLPIAMMLAAWPWLWHASERFTAVVMGVVVLASSASLWMLSRPLETQKANRAHAYVESLMPASSSAERGVAILGLPAECVPIVGARWPQQRAAIEKACPFVYSVSRFGFLRFVAEEPRALVRAAARALPSLHGVAPPALGTRSDAPGKGIDDMPWWGFSPLRFVDASMPPAVGIAVSIAAFVAAPLALIALIVLRRWRGDPLSPLMVAMLLGGAALYSFLSTVYGAGVVSGRPDVVGTLAAYALLVMALAGLPLLFVRWMRTPKEAMLEVGVGAAVLAATLYACFAGATWVASQAAAAPAPVVVPEPAPAPPVPAPAAPAAPEPAAPAPATTTTSKAPG